MFEKYLNDYFHTTHPGGDVISIDTYCPLASGELIAGDTYFMVCMDQLNEQPSFWFNVAGDVRFMNAR